MPLSLAQAAFRRTLFLTAGAGLIIAGVLAAWRLPVGGGFAIGCAAGVTAYSALARLLSAFLDVSAQERMRLSTRQTIVRLVLYAAAFSLAYKLEPTHASGLIAALCGFLFVRIAVTVHAWRGARAGTDAPRP